MLIKLSNANDDDERKKQAHENSRRLVEYLKVVLINFSQTFSKCFACHHRHQYNTGHLDNCLNQFVHS